MPDLVTDATRMSDALLWWFFETTLIASALAVLATLAARIRPITPGPAARHALWLMVIVKLVTPPLVHWPWTVPSAMASARPEQARPVAGPARPEDRRQDDRVGVDPGPDRGPVAIRGASAASLLEAFSDPVETPGSVAAEDPSPCPGFALALPPPPRWLGPGTMLAWLVGSVTLGAGQARRVVRFRRLLAGASPPPAWLAEEVDRVGRRLAVRAPEIRVVPGLGTPLLWCLGRPMLLIPEGLLASLKPGDWRPILAHELAHFLRGDHWVRRLELAAGLIWWWNPLYWLARGRLDFEAELACDAWAVWESPDGRLSYAESLVRICTTLSSARSPEPALGVAGTGHSFERRLTMILHDRVDRRISAPSLLAATLLATLALPSWTQADPLAVEDERPAVVKTVAEPVVLEVRTPALATIVPSVITFVEPVFAEVRTSALATVSPAVTAVVAVEIDGDDPDDDETAEARKETEKEKSKTVKLKAEREALQAKSRAMAKEMEAKFGPDSEFARKMEQMSKELEAKFGAGSEFATKMEAMGKEIEAKFGPGSEFAKEMEKKFGDDFDFARKAKEGADDEGRKEVRSEARESARKAEVKARADAAQARAETQRTRAETQRARAKAEARARADAAPKFAPQPDKRDRRIEDLETTIRKLKAELERLKAEPDQEDDGEKGSRRP